MKEKDLSCFGLIFTACVSTRSSFLLSFLCTNGFFTPCAYSTCVPLFVSLYVPFFVLPHLCCCICSLLWSSLSLFSLYVFHSVLVLPLNISLLPFVFVLCFCLNESLTSCPCSLSPSEGQSVPVCPCFVLPCERQSVPVCPCSVLPCERQSVPLCSDDGGRSL